MRLRCTLLAALTFLPVLLTGCKASNQSVSEVLISDGCVIYMKGIGSISAQEIAKKWEFTDDCAVIVNSESGSSE